MAAAKSSVKDRKYFRIKYPDELRPELIVNGMKHALVDVSEAGLKYSVSNSAFPLIGVEFTATISFQTGKTLTVKGHIVRTDHQHVMVQLSKGIASDILKEEADLLLEKYGVVPTDHY